jgi:signal transduction histidine kinase
MFEKRLLDWVAAISPWLAPLVPTYFAAYNAYYYLAKGKAWWDVGAVVVVALVVETIGLAGVHTAIQFWNWNRTRLKSDDAAPLGMAVAAVVVYVAIIILVNGLLDFFAVADPGALPYVKIVAVALLSLLALNSALIVALRAGQSDRENRAESARQERKDAATSRKVSGKVADDEGKVSGKFPADWRKARPFMSFEEVQEIAQMSTKQIQEKYHLAQEKTARNWRGYAVIEVEQKAEAK